MAYMRDKNGIRLDSVGVTADPVITGMSPPLVGGVSSTSHPTVVGTAPPLSLVTLYLNGAAVATGFADSGGAFAISIPAQLNGQANIIARSTPASALFSFIINDSRQPLQNAAGATASFELDTERGLFYTAGVPYSDAASLIGAVGGTAAGALASMGGYIDPAALNVLLNGGFDTDTTGWNAYNGATMAVTANELVITHAGSDTVSQTVAGYPGRAFRFQGSGRRGTNASNSPSMGATTQNPQISGNATLAAAVTATKTTYSLHVSSVSGLGMYVGVKGATSTGTTIWDDFSLTEAMPFAGWAAPAAGAGSAGTAFSVLVDAVAPSALPATGTQQIIWQADTNSVRDRIRIAQYDDGTVRFLVVANNSTILNYTLGTVAAGARFRVALAAAAGANGDALTGYAASLNGLNSLSLYNSATPMVGVSHMRIGQEYNGTLPWQGTINRVAVVPGRQAVDWLEFQAALPTATPRVFAGDSYVGGASGVVLPDLYETATGQITINIGVGGSTLAAQKNVITSRSYLRKLPMVHWDGSNNGMVDVASQVAIAQQIWDWKADGRMLWLPSIAVPNPGQPSSPTPSTFAAMLRDYRDALITAFGAAHVYDPVPILQALATSSTDDQNDVAAGLIPRSIMLTQNNGEVHLGTAAMNAIATHTVFQSKVAAL